MANESQQNINTGSDEISLKDLIFKLGKWRRYLFSKWLIILLSGLLGGALGFYYAYCKKPIYTATTTFVLEDEKGSGGLGNLAGLASIAGVDVGGGGGIFQGDNIMELYKSRKMIVQTLMTEVIVDEKKQTLAERYIEFNGLRKSWAKNPAFEKLKFANDRINDGIKSLSNNRLRDSLIGLMVADITMNYLTVSKPDKKLAIIKVDVRSQDEFFAKAFDEAIVKNVNDFYTQTKTKKSLQNVQIVQHKTDSVRAIMNRSIYTAVAIADATPNLNPTKQVQRIAPAQKAQFSAETNRAILSSLVQNLEMSKVALMKETPLLEIIDKPVYPLFKEGLGRIKGIISGGLIAGILCIIVLILSEVYKNIINE